MNVVEMKNVTKIFGNFKANDKINLNVKQNEIHAILGENGAGKSTLMNNLFGLYKIDDGEILINGKPALIENPNDAKKLGIGMVHQHFMLVDTFSIFENIILGDEPKNKKEAKEKLNQIIQKYNFNLDIDDKVRNLTVGQEQKVEILKILYKDADIIVFDEPTAVLTPGETVEFLNIMKQLQKQGKTLILITHKLNEIKSVANRCTIIRKGKSIETVSVENTDEKTFANLMVGKEIDLSIHKEPVKSIGNIIEIRNLIYKDKRNITKLHNINLDISKGKILGVAGVDNNGQKELADILARIKMPTSGKVTYLSDENSKINLLKKSIKEINKEIISYIPEDRIKEALISEYTISENAILLNYKDEKFGKNNRLDKHKMRNYGKEISEKYDVRSAYGLESKVKGLSGGNQQKLIIGRAIENDTEIIIAFQPTRGVDVSAIKFIHDKLIEQRDQGKTIILISMELNEIMSLSDEIIVLHDGHLIDKVSNENITKEEIGLMMAGKKVDKNEK